MSNGAVSGFHARWRVLNVSAGRVTGNNPENWRLFEKVCVMGESSDFLIAVGSRLLLAASCRSAELR